MNVYYNRTEVGLRLRKRRKEMRVTAGRLAELINKAPNYYRDIERGTCGMSVETLIQLAEFMGLSVDYIIFGNSDNSGKISHPDAAFRLLAGYDEGIQKNAIQLMKTYLRFSDAECKKNA